MGQHRAERRGLRRSLPSTRGSQNRSVSRVETVTAPATLHDAITETIPVVDVPVLDTEATVVLPSPSAPGKRKAVRRPRAKMPLATGAPSPPILLGVAALALAIGGAVVTDIDPQLTAAEDRAARQASAHGGTSSILSVGALPDRGRPISRDSDRQTLEGAADAKLQKAAEKQTRQRDAALGRLAQAAEAQAAELAENRWVLPLESYRLTARYGEYGLWASYHTGLDFSAPSGTPIRAVANGVVTETGYQGSYGNLTVIRHEDGTETWYAHQTSFTVSPGDSVAGGDIIGYVGSTGNSTGPHLHLEVRPGGGDPVDPLQALIVHGLNP